jgi:hypothetical protein
MTTKSEVDEGVLGFASLQTGSLESLRSMLCVGVEGIMGEKDQRNQESSYLELVQARHHYFSNASASTATNTVSEEVW